MIRIHSWLLILLISLPLAAEWVQTGEARDRSGLCSYQQVNDHQITLQFQLDGFEEEVVNRNGIIFDKVTHEQAVNLLDPGKPELLQFSYLLAIPDEGEVSYNILEEDIRILPDYRIHPAQELKTESGFSDPEFCLDNLYYNSSRLYPEEWFRVGEPSIMRNLRVIPVTFYPLRYQADTGELHIIRDIQLEINISDRGGENTPLVEKRKSHYFEPLFASMVLNYQDLVNRTAEFQDPSYLFIYPDDAQIAQYLQVLTDWKHEKGFQVEAVTVTAAGSSQISIREFIQNAYDTWENPPEFVCLVGDAGGIYSIPTGHYSFGGYGGEGDHYYSLLEGDDILADIFIGRLSFNSLMQFQTILGKILNYEKNPYLGDMGWYNRALMVGDPSDSGPSCVDTKIYVGDMIEYYSPDYDLIEVYSGNWVQSINNAFNQGISYFNYRGFVGVSGWHNGHVDNLNNGFMLPVAVILTCLTGDFEGTNDCLSERLLKAGSPTLPKGAIAAICTATGNTHTCFNNCVDAGIFEGIFVDGISNMGGALNRGKLNLYLSYPDNPFDHVTKFSYWNNLMGDPGMEVWTGVPQTLNVSCPASIPLGTNYLTIDVLNEDDVPLENARVTVLKGEDEIFATGLTDREGSIILPVQCETAGEILLTITKHNYIPFQQEIQLETGQTVINSLQTVIDDDNQGGSSGNGDGQLNPGETVELQVGLYNAGNSNVYGVEAFLTSLSEGVEIISSQTVYGEISAQSMVIPDEGFVLTVSPDLVAGTELLFRLNIQDDAGGSWQDYIFLSVHGALLEVAGYQVEDGNNDLLEPGESAQLVVVLENLGEVGVSGVTGILASLDNDLQVIDCQGGFGNIDSGGSGENNDDTFTVAADDLIVPGTMIALELTLESENGFTQTTYFQIQIGEADINDPLGPDAFGHYIYDDEDTFYINSPAYNWIEIDPVYGGGGTALGLIDVGNMGGTAVIGMPFNLRFYGRDYDQLTVCTNGWLAPGVNQSASFMNWGLPGPLGPSPIIAAFWDDLKLGDIVNSNYIPNGGSVCTWYNEAENYLVIEWSRLQNEYNDAIETFEAIIYDPFYYPTSNGDCQILIQYHTVNNIDQGNYESVTVAHGQYATVGIEDHSSQDGLQYTYDNEYPVSAKPLSNNTAILISGSPLSTEDPYLVLGSVDFTDENSNGQIDYGEEIGIAAVLTNLGGSPANNVSGTISSEDDYVTITSNSAAFGNIPSGETGSNQDNFVFIVDDVCPDGHIVYFSLTVAGDEDSWAMPFNLILHAPVIQVLEITVEDGNNHILDPGESGLVNVSFQNMGSATAYQVNSEILIDDPYLITNSGIQTLGTMEAGEIVEVSFDMTVSPAAPIGHQADLEWSINAEAGYEFYGIIPLCIVQYPVNLQESFEVFPPPGWDLSGGFNWLHSYSNAAGGYPPEAIFWGGIPAEGRQRLITGPINTLGSTVLTISFHQIINTNYGDYALGLETTDDGIHWRTVWELESPPNMLGLQTIDIQNSDVGSQYFQLGFFFDGLSTGINYWGIDDITLVSQPVVPHAYLMGNVQLLAGPGDVEEAIIQAGTAVTSPDSAGNYILQIEPGLYDIQAYLPGYISDWIYGIDIPSPWITLNQDFQLAVASVNNPPENLQYELDVFNVTLNWDLPGTTGQGNRGMTMNLSRLPLEFAGDEGDDVRFLQGYNIYKNGDLAQFIADIQQTWWPDNNLNQGNYQYYVTALYEEGETTPSNQVELDVILPPPLNLTAAPTPTGQHVILDWESPNQYADSYNIYRDEIWQVETTSTYYFDANVQPGPHIYWVTTLYGENESDPAIAEVVLTEAGNGNIPLLTELLGNVPNPFNPETRINFALSAPGHVRLEIYNVKGQSVRSLLDTDMEPGLYHLNWDGTDLSGRRATSGIYFYRLEVDTKTIQTRRMLLLK